MKKLYALCIIAIAIAGKSSAQVQNGEKMVGLSAGIYTQDNKQIFEGVPESKRSSLGSTLSPQFGLGVGKGWVLGVSGNVSHFKVEHGKGPSLGENSYNLYGAGVFARKFYDFNNRFGVFGQAELNFSAGKVKYDYTGYPDVNGKFTGFDAYVVPGAYYRLSDRLIIETMLGGVGYTKATSKYENSSYKGISKGFNFSLTNNFGLGFKVRF